MLRSAGINVREWSTDWFGWARGDRGELHWRPMDEPEQCQVQTYRCRRIGNRSLVIRHMYVYGEVVIPACEYCIDELLRWL